ncbi:TetR/AcrR family transcriptional regulator [Pseudonocardia lutea]|jgi:AcrR family transcriptional regulator|uniref:TetR/AcrR family transcriptional regulator n=1 Tax=Pseudonocardia lutea TaxID=2172015 RepID=A0ABW1I9I0_9PSEU
MTAAPSEPPTPSGPPPRTRRARGAAGARRPVYDASSLLAVAVQEFNTRGYDATSMEDLSRAAGITKSSFYHHVSGKEDLLRAALSRALDGLFGILEEPAAQEGTALDRLRHIIYRQVEVLTSELPYVTLLLRVRGNTETERWALARRRAFDASIASLVAEAVADGEVRAGVEPSLAARLLSGTVNSIIEWYRPGRPGSESLPGEVVRIVSEGIIPPA